MRRVRVWWRRDHSGEEEGQGVVVKDHIMSPEGEFISTMCSLVYLHSLGFLSPRCVEKNVYFLLAY